MTERIAGVDPFHTNGSSWKQENYEGNNDEGYMPFIVKREDNKFFAGADDGTNSFCEVSEEIAKVIIVGIEAEKRLKQRGLEWDAAATIENGVGFDFGKLGELKDRSLIWNLFSNFNCHRVVRYILGIGADEESFERKYRAIEGFAFKTVNSLEELEGLVATHAFPIVGRVAGFGYYNVLRDENDAHSFLVLGKDDAGRYICFEKAGRLSHPVRLTTLEHIYSYYTKSGEDRKRMYSWGFQELEKVKEKTQ